MSSKVDMWNPFDGSSQTYTYSGKGSGKVAAQMMMANYANQTNYQMNKENNQLQMELANQANEFTHNERVEQNEWNRQQELDARAYNEQMRDEQREYDSPAAQMQRLIEAGINPNMMASGGFSSGSGSSSVQGQAAAGASNGSGQMADVNPSQVQPADLSGQRDFMDLIQVVSDVFGQVSQSVKDGVSAWNSGAIAKRIPARFTSEMQLNQSKTELNDMLLSWYFEQLPYLGSNMAAEEQFKKAQTTMTNWLTDKYKNDSAYIEAQTYWWPRIAEAQINEMSKNADLLAQKKLESDAKRSAIYQEIKESKARIVQMEKEGKLTDAQTEAQTLQNHLVETYGEEEAQKALRQYDDAHNTARIETIMKTLDIKPGKRGEVAKALMLVNFRSQGEFEDYLRFMDSIKGKSKWNQDVPQNWLYSAATLFGTWIYGKYTALKAESRSPIPIGQSGGIPATPWSPPSPQSWQRNW